MGVKGPAIGAVSELRVTAAFLEAEIPVSATVSTHTRYDLVVETEPAVFRRVQVKTAKLQGGRYCFMTSSNYGNIKVRDRYKQTDFDYLAVYCRDDDNVYLIPVQDLDLEQRSVAIEPACMAKYRMTPTIYMVTRKEDERQVKLDI